MYGTVNTTTFVQMQHTIISPIQQVRKKGRQRRNGTGIEAYIEARDVSIIIDYSHHPVKERKTQVEKTFEADNTNN